MATINTRATKSPSSIVGRCRPAFEALFPELIFPVSLYECCFLSVWYESYVVFKELTSVFDKKVKYHQDIIFPVPKKSSGKFFRKHPNFQKKFFAPANCRFLADFIFVFHPAYAILIFRFGSWKAGNHYFSQLNRAIKQQNKEN